MSNNSTPSNALASSPAEKLLQRSEGRIQERSKNAIDLLRSALRDLENMQAEGNLEQGHYTTVLLSVGVSVSQATFCLSQAGRAAAVYDAAAELLAREQEVAQ